MALSSPNLKSTSSTSTITWLSVGLYGYDTFNRRVCRDALIEDPDNSGDYLGVERLLTYDGWQCQEEYTKVGPDSYQIFKVHLDGIGIDEHLGFAIATHVNNQVNWTKFTLVQDAQGNVMELLDKDGNRIERYRYDVYGNRTVYSWSGTAWNVKLGPSLLYDQQYGYTGRRHDPESLLMYYRLRYYSPLQGRFLTQDPIGNWGDGANLGNGYAYVGNQGAIASDALGLFSVMPTPQGAGSATPSGNTGNEGGGEQDSSGGGIASGHWIFIKDENCGRWKVYMVFPGQGEGILDNLDNGVWRDVTEKVTDGDKWKIGRIGESSGFTGVPHPPAVHLGEPGLFVTAEDWASFPVVTSGGYHNKFTAIWLQNSMHGANFFVHIIRAISRLSPLDESTTNLLRGWFLDMKYTFVKLDENGCPGAGLLVSLIEQRWVDIPGEYVVTLWQVYGN